MLKLIKGLKFINDFIDKNNLQTRIIPVTAYQYPAKFKPTNTLVVSLNGEEVIVVAVSKDSFWLYVLVENSEVSTLINNIKLGLKKEGLTYVR